MKIFSAGPKISNLYFLEYLNFADSKSVLRFFISFLDQRLQPFNVGSLWLFLAVLTSLWRAVIFNPRKIWRIWEQIWNQRDSNILESINSIFLAEPKNSFFCSSFFIFIFQFSKIFCQLKYSAKNYFSNGVWFLNIA